MSTPALVMQPGLPPAVRRVRGYFAPVESAQYYADGIRRDSGGIL